MARDRLHALLDLRLQGGYETARFKAVELDEIARDFRISKLSLFDELGRYMALRYHAGTLNFETGDQLASNLFVLLLDEDFNPPPQVFWDVHDAFDAGEYHRSPGKTDDPEADFTRPLIADIVRKHGLDPWPDPAGH